MPEQKRWTSPAYHQQTVETWIAFTDMDGNEASTVLYR